MRLCIKEIGILFICTTLDRISKVWALRNLKGGEEYSIFPSLKLRLTFNEGSAFGIKLFEWNPSWIILTTLLIMGLYLFRIKTLRYRIGRALVVSGAIGNLIDRLLKGKVIDFISFYKWPTFNLADSFITLGLLLLVLSILRDDHSKS